MLEVAFGFAADADLNIRHADLVGCIEDASAVKDGRLAVGRVSHRTAREPERAQTCQRNDESLHTLILLVDRLDRNDLRLTQAR